MSVVASPALRSLVELASNLVRATQRLASGSWDHALVQRTREAFERLADHAANLDLEQVRMAALDLYIYLTSLDSELAPDSAQSSEIGRLSAALNAAVIDTVDDVAAAMRLWSFGIDLFNGMQPRGLTPGFNQRLNKRLRDGLQRVQDALQAPGLPPAEAQAESRASARTSRRHPDDELCRGPPTFPTVTRSGPSRPL